MAGLALAEQQAPLDHRSAAGLNAEQQRLLDAMCAAHQGLMVSRQAAVATISKFVCSMSYGNLQRCPVRSRFVGGKSMYLSAEIFRWAIEQLNADPCPKRNPDAGRYRRAQSADSSNHTSA